MKRLYGLSLYVITLIAFLVASLQSWLDERRQLKDASLRASSLITGIEESVQSNYERNRPDRTSRLVNRLRENQRVYGVGLCIGEDLKTFQAQGFPKGNPWRKICQQYLSSTDPAAHQGDYQWIQKLDSVRYQIYSRPLPVDSVQPVTLVLAQDLSYLRSQWIETFFRSLVITWLVGLALVVLVATQIQRWIRTYLRYLHQVFRALIAGRKPPALSALLVPGLSTSPDLAPITRDINNLAAKILTLPTQAAASSKPKESSWLASLKETIGKKKVVIVANREPYIHQRRGEKIEVVRPASGLVTALEPILRNAGGLWLGHGSGSADREVVNAQDEVAVPPNNPKYTLKRVWLTKEEEEGYYYGFSNEGLWPLCHLAHNRPTFRLSDWEKYCSVNQKFSDQMPASVLNSNSLVLVQDYHFAMLPRMLKVRAAARGNAYSAGPKIALFWHIPWPNPEAFGICPWYKELLTGMLGSDVIGFHTQYHCNNFLETCERYLEARVDWENLSVTMDNHETLVRAFPIGIDTSPVAELNETERQALKARYGIKADLVAVGVDRIDYTKGLVERVEAVERFLEKYPEYIGKFSLVQMGSPSRTHIPAYKALAEQLERTVLRVNSRFGDASDPKGYQPIVLITEHHEWDDIQYFYQLGDICMVTSLHDGMNLVAKEYIWCQKPERGALILSKFTGAARELTDSFIVNPYSVEEMADALAAAVQLSPAERARRMAPMRDKVENHNAFQWASDLIRTLANEVRHPQNVEPLRPASGGSTGFTSNGLPKRSGGSSQGILARIGFH